MTDAASWHEALLYTSTDQYVAGVLRFVAPAIARSEPVLVAVPADHAAPLRAGLDRNRAGVRFEDMTRLGHNPSRIIPAIQRFADEHRRGPVTFVGEPIWAGRSADEIAEATRHEALLNLAFADAGVHVLCAYDTAALEPDVVADAHRTHPVVIDAGGRPARSGDYAAPMSVWQRDTHLPPPPPRAHRVEVHETSEVGDVRRLVRAAARRIALTADRVGDAMLVATELVANSLRHGGGCSTVTLWAGADGLTIDVRDRGQVREPLVGRRAPGLNASGGRGLWLVNCLCDLVQLHSGPAGTTVRVQLR